VFLRELDRDEPSERRADNVDAVRPAEVSLEDVQQIVRFLGALRLCPSFFEKLEKATAKPCGASRSTTSGPSAGSAIGASAET
jgi:hypothetical protein